LTPTASRENISAIIELTDEKGSRVIGAAPRSGALSLRDEAAIFAQSVSQRHASASPRVVASQRHSIRVANRFRVPDKVCRGGVHSARPIRFARSKRGGGWHASNDRTQQLFQTRFRN
jgi:hypothetical protein